jgi:transmembrane sensor
MTGRRSGRVLRTGAVERALGHPEQAPLVSVLDAELEEAAVPELWHRIDARLARPRVQRQRAALGVMLAAAAVLALFLFGARWLNHAGGERALALAGGRAPAVLSAAEHDGAFDFDDGSRIDVAPFTDLHVVLNDARTFVTALERGRSTFDVRPGGPRRWVIEAGTATVEVIGTRFSVRHEDTSVRVDVERGIVLVRSATLAGGSVRLTAGQSVVVTAPLPASSAPPAVAAASAAASSARPPPSAAELASSAPELTPPPAPASHAAPTALETRLPSSHVAETRATPSTARLAADSEPDAVERALSAADAARRRGDRLEAERALEEALAAASSADKRRGLAALSLARLILTTEPRRAASVLRESFGAMPAGLVEDALARRVEAEGRAGNFAEARRLAAEYERRFPSGQRLREVTRWSGD